MAKWKSKPGSEHHPGKSNKPFEIPQDMDAIDHMFVPPFQKGDIVGKGKYEIVSTTVNAGGFGRIYRAISSKHNSTKKYAVKEFFVETDRGNTTSLSTMGVYTHKGTTDKFDRQRCQFFIEAKLLGLVWYGDIGRRHIPKIFGLPYEEGGRIFYVMEYIEGATITEEVLNWGPMLEKRAISLIMQICKILFSAHNIGLVHSDISPNNIILRNGNTAVLVDFGNARSYDEELTQTTMDDRTRRGFSPYQEALDRVSEQTPDLTEENQGAIDSIGTPFFQAPDKFKGQPEGDVYSLACTLFFMLTGQMPKPGMDPHRALSAFGISWPTAEAIHKAMRLRYPSNSNAVGYFLQDLTGIPFEKL